MTLDAIRGSRGVRLMLCAVALLLAFRAGQSVALNNRLELLIMFGLPAIVILLAHPFVGLVVFAATVPLEILFVLEGGLTGLRLFGPVLFAVWLVDLIFSGRHFRPPRVLWLYVLFLAWAFLSVLWALNQEVALERALSFAQLVGFGVVTVEMVRTRRRAYWVTGVLVGSSILSAVLGLLNAGATTEATTRMTVQVGQAIDEFGFYVGAGVLCAGLLAIYARTQFRNLALAGLVVTIYPLYAVASRQAMVAIALSMLILTLLERGKTRILITFIFVLGLLFGSWALLQRTTLLPWETLEHLTVQNAIASGGGGRSDIWRVALETAVSNPVLGVGLDNFKLAYSRYEALLLPYLAKLHGSADAHNIFLQILTELGIVGLALFVVPLGWTLRRLLSRLQEARDKDDQLLSLLVLGLLLYAIISGLFSTYLWRKGFWLILALGAAHACMPFQQSASEVKGTPG